MILISNNHYKLKKIMEQIHYSPHNFDVEATDNDLAE